MPATRFAFGSLLLAFLVATTVGCGDDATPSGPYEFVSADGYEGERSPPGGGADAGAGVPDDGSGGEDRTVEEGDIYRMLDEDTLLNLNSFRGLQVVDLSDLSAPRVIGNLRVSGSPVELYVVGDRAVVLMNSWRGYYGSRDDVRVEGVEGGLVMTVDLSDHTSPQALDRAPVPGWIRTSRLAREGSRASLYVAATHYDTTGGTWEARTVVKSFDVTAPKIAAQSELDLGGYVADVQATPEALLVAHSDWTGTSGSTVSLVDITDPGGRMVAGGDVVVSGQVGTQFNMDLRGGVLRVVSGSTWGTTTTNHLETFDAADLSAPSAIDHCTFGDGQQLFATLFLEDRAFFVTYLRVDPFHAFSIDAAGHCEERSEFVVSGWNDYFRPVLDDSRLLGIGVNDEAGRTMAVSLYDITDLSNPSPLLARAEVEADSSWSEANWDHRAFTVLEDAVAATAPDGTPETGLVLLPFHGWNEGAETYQAAVQIYTFSDSTLTRRGLMDHGTPVRRSFVAQTGVAANLSEAELSLYDTSDPDAPAELGRAELAPSYTRVLDYGGHVVRLEDTQSYYWWWGGRASPPAAYAEVVAPGDDPDRAEPVARIAVPTGAQLLKVGSLLVAVRSVPTDTSSWPYDYETTVDVHDLSTPASPVARGTLTTDRIDPGAYGYPGDCWDWCGGWYGAPTAVVAGEAAVFTRAEDHRELLGSERVCHVYPDVWEDCTDRSSCTHYSGGITCRSLDGAPEVCSGSLARCTWDEESGRETCEPVDESSVATTRSCYDTERYRYWQSYTLDVLDLSDPDRPRLAAPLALPTDDEASAVLEGDGSRAFYTYRRPVGVAGDPRPHVAWFFRSIDLADPSRPSLGAAVNVPGQLLEVSGRTLLTRDLRWGDEVAETVIHRLEWRDDRAYLQASRRFTDRSVQSVQLDGAGHVLVTHGPHWSGPWYGGVGDGPGVPDSTLVRLSVLSATDLGEIAAVDVDSWASLRGAAGDRALFQVPGGLLLMSLAEPATPRMQAYFPTQGWPSEVLFEGDDILFAAGPYGIYRFDADEENLLSRE